MDTAVHDFAATTPQFPHSTGIHGPERTLKHHAAKGRLEAKATPEFPMVLLRGMKLGLFL